MTFNKGGQWQSEALLQVPSNMISGDWMSVTNEDALLYAQDDSNNCYLLFYSQEVDYKICKSTLFAPLTNHLITISLRNSDIKIRRTGILWRRSLCLLFSVLCAETFSALVFPRTMQPSSSTWVHLHLRDIS